MIYTDSKHLFFSVIQPHTRDGGIFFTFLLSILFLLSMLNQVLKYFCIHLQRIILAATLCVAALLFGCTTAGKVFNIIKESIRIIILARTELSLLCTNFLLINGLLIGGTNMFPKPKLRPGFALWDLPLSWHEATLYPNTTHQSHF